VKGRKRSAESGAPGPADGLDARAWAVVCESATAAHHGDAGAHVAPLLRYEREAPQDIVVGAYLWYLLRYRVVELLKVRPSAEDLRALADRYYPAFSKLIRGDQGQLAGTLLTVFALAAEDRKVSGGKAAVLGSAALGVLLEHPQAELAAMRPHLAAWWERNATIFRAAN
jgi:hypothetical protein